MIMLPIAMFVSDNHNSELNLIIVFYYFNHLAFTSYPSTFLGFWKSLSTLFVNLHPRFEQPIWAPNLPCFSIMSDRHIGHCISLLTPDYSRLPLSLALNIFAAFRLIAFLAACDFTISPSDSFSTSTIIALIISPVLSIPALGNPSKM